MMIIKVLKSLLIILLLLAEISYAQQQATRLTEIALERKSYHSSQMEKARAYAKEHNIPMTFQDDKGNYISLMGVDDFGLPVYWTTLNAGAAITTNVVQLRTGGSLGLNLEGEGITVGVWDHQRVHNHAEFDGRVISFQGNISELSQHSTHVTGTIIASGLQSNAKGMAPKARATTWDFDNDDSEMATLAKPDQTSLLFSNHSYGTVLGWFHNGSSWQWAGNSAISTQEDYRFGFYASKSRTIDQIAFNAPYYTIVWAAGNDRSDTGDGTRPPDGNQGTGYDCLSPEGVAKNNITVGAVQKVSNYTGPSSIVMSNFSSWGPTDDGRIKPDLVGAGVSVFSTSVNNGADAYSTQQGTSMSAPNVTGSLVLLQELYRDLHAGNYMRAATLKALAIHTAKEAGLNPGPDYSFGWGLLDVGAAAKVLLEEDQQSVVVQELTLQNNEVFELDFEPVQNTKVTATIAWTDPPGTPVSPQLDPTDRMLVNDLDMRLLDGANNTVSPWILNPAVPSGAATRGDNFRDNVEKIEFDSPEPRLYTLRVNHKGQLANNSQNFSLILTYTPLNDPKVAYYWIGNSGNWNNPANWSLSSGGSPANLVPDINSRVIIDERSFSGPDQTISLTANATCASVTWLTKAKANLSLNGNTLSIEGNFIVSSAQFSATTAGGVQLLGGTSSQYQLNLNNSDLSLVTFYINSNSGATWTVNGPIDVEGIILQKGGLVARGITVKTNRLNAFTPDSKVLDITNTEITELNESILNAANLQFTSPGSTIKLINSGTATLTWTGIDFEGSLDTQGSQTTFSGGATVNRIQIGGAITIAGNNAFDQFVAGPGATINIQTGTRQTLTSQTEFLSTSDNRIEINTNGAGTSELGFDGHFKLCFNYLDVSNVGLDGDVTVSAGANSTLINANNWVPGSCGEALFADFTFRYNCIGALTEFTDASDGNITSWEWDFGDPPGDLSLEQNPTHVYENTTTYIVTLTVSDGVQSTSYSRDVSVIANNLPTNKVIIANEKLFSELTAEFYQWYKNGEKLETETGRWYEYNGDQGAYFVVIKNSVCSSPSAVFLISSVDEYNLANELRIYPNPASDKIYITLPQQRLPARATLINSLGQRVLSETLWNQESVISTSELHDGFYILDISAGAPLRKKIIIKR